MSYFHKFVEFSKALLTTYRYIAKNYLPLLQQIADLLKKIGVVGTLVNNEKNLGMNEWRLLQVRTFQMSRLKKKFE